MGTRNREGIFSGGEPQLFRASAKGSDRGGFAGC